MKEIRVGITGGSWITATGYGRLRSGVVPRLSPGRPVIPAARDLFDRPLSRYGRFDTYTKLGCAAAALALSDAELSDNSEKRPIGIVTSSSWDSTSVDLAYYETTLPEDGALSSPNLFSYTLPGTMQGECAVHFRLTGPTVCVGEDGGRGYAALRSALRLMSADAVGVMIAGWLDDPPRPREPVCAGSEIVGGAVLVILERTARSSPKPVGWIRYSSGVIRSEAGEPIGSVLDLFGKEPAGRPQE